MHNCFFIVMNKANIINMQELTEDNDFGLALSVKPIINQGTTIYY